ncbi:MAG: YueI family protein [Streptococcaceae bacterium]|jgi:uncharacterized protein YueI|nr:YueI family protein [Streptococcaceae bacterium]
MSDLENRLDRASSGEYRLNPDQQKLYLNTFRERVLLAITFSDAENRQLKTHFDAILATFDGQYDHVFVKICGDLPSDLIGFYLKHTTDHHFDGQILTEGIPEVYGIVIHTDHAINLEQIELADVFPEINLTDTASQDTHKKGFLAKLFD